MGTTKLKCHYTSIGSKTFLLKLQILFSRTILHFLTSPPILCYTTHYHSFKLDIALQNRQITMDAFMSRQTGDCFRPPCHSIGPVPAGHDSDNGDDGDDQSDFAQSTHPKKRKRRRRRGKRKAKTVTLRSTPSPELTGSELATESGLGSGDAEASRPAQYRTPVPGGLVGRESGMFRSR
jgi:hypothetical protein